MTHSPSGLRIYVIIFYWILHVILFRRITLLLNKSRKLYNSYNFCSFAIEQKLLNSRKLYNYKVMRNHDEEINKILDVAEVLKIYRMAKKKANFIASTSFFFLLHLERLSSI